MGSGGSFSAGIPVPYRKQSRDLLNLAVFSHRISIFNKLFRIKDFTAGFI